MAFTEIEMAVLSQLAYCDVPYTPETGKTLADFIGMESVKKYLWDKMGEDYYDTVLSLAQKGKDYEIVAACNDRYGSGFAAFAVADSNNEVTVACRGTEPPGSTEYDIEIIKEAFQERIKQHESGEKPLTKEEYEKIMQVFLGTIAGSELIDFAKDILTDAEIGLLEETNQQKEMEKFVRRLEAKGYSGFYFTGHSLGGNLAMHGAIILRDPSKLKGVKVYNAPGFNKKYYAKQGMKINRVQDKIVCFQNEKDPVSSLFDSPGTIVIVKTTGENHHSFIGFALHNGCFMTTTVKEPGLFTTGLEVVTEGIDQKWYWEMFKKYSAYGRWEEKEICRDFSEGAKNVFIGAAKEVEDEKWWDVTKWDIWYRGQDAIYGLEWDLYSGQVDSYYRKLIDVNDASVKDIENIFEKVYGIDDTYAAKINDLVEKIKVGVTTVATNLHESIVPTT